MSMERSPFYKPELDVLRFVAFSMVFLYHFIPASLAQASLTIAVVQRGCEQGVQIFFLLSAFLITELLLREQERTSTIHLAAFYIRRILRIWPLYFLLILSATILTLMHRAAGFPLEALTYFSLLAGNWYVVLHGYVSSFVAPLWTISIEEQFYLLWPLSLGFGSTRGLVILSSLFGILSYGMLFLLGTKHAAEHTVRANSFVEFQFFALGAGLAVLLHGSNFRPGVWGRSLCVAISAVTTWMAIVHFGIIKGDGVSSVDLMGGYFMLAISTVCFFLVFLNAALPSWARPLIYLGRISYGLYAFHFAAFSVGASITHRLVPFPKQVLATVAIHTLLTIGLCLLAAILSFRFIERPFLKLKAKFSFVTSRDDAPNKFSQDVGENILTAFSS